MARRAVTLKSGLPQIQARMRGGVARALRQGAESIARDAAQRVPVGPPDVHLKDNIHVEKPAPSYTYLVVAGGEENHLYYGHMVEFGTSHSAPRPFLVPAAEAGAAPTVALVQAVLSRA